MQSRLHLRQRALLFAVLAVGTLSCVLRAEGVPQQQQQAPAPVERRPAQQPHPGMQDGSRQGNARSRVMHGEHLAEWMSRHSSLTLQQQQQALQNEPGFHTLPAPTQQRMQERLSQLDAMPPAKRQRIMDRTEAIERLSPDQRAQVRGAMSQLGSLPMPERHEVARTFRALRDLPEQQRMAALSSGRYGALPNEQDRAALMNLLRVEPMLPPPEARPNGPTQMPPGTQAFH